MQKIPSEKKTWNLLQHQSLSEFKPNDSCREIAKMP